MRPPSFFRKTERIRRAGKPFSDSHFSTRVPPSRRSSRQTLITEIPKVRLVQARMCGPPQFRAAICATHIFRTRRRFVPGVSRSQTCQRLRCAVRDHRIQRRGTDELDLLWTLPRRSRAIRRRHRSRLPCQAVALQRPQASLRRSVAFFGNSTRTQNGHIRNDTRDVSRRISSLCNRPICRRKCVASDRACTRVTLRNLHGKEGSTVRVRQRALQKRRKAVPFCRKNLDELQRAEGWEPLWSFHAHDRRAGRTCDGYSPSQ